MTNPINSRTAREKLEPRREPYFVRLRAGLFVGYRRIEEGEGTWIARLRTLEGKQRYQSLGTFADYDSAAKACGEWADSLDTKLEAPEVSASMTVQKVCAAYVAYQKLHKSEKAGRDSAARFKYLVDGLPIGLMLISSLRTVHMHEWIARQVAGKEGETLRRAKDSANRQLATFKAALNFGYRNGMVASDAAWRSVVPFRAVGRRRQGFVSSAAREKLLNTAALDIRAFITAMLLTAARPGELAGVTCAHFDKEQGTIQLDGKTGHRVVALSSAALAFFLRRAEFKIGNALLLTTTGGDKWTKERWIKAFDAAVRSAQLADGIVMYSLRHTAISEMIAGGMDVFVVARLAGTSTAMIDKHYGHLRADRTRAMLDSINLLSAAA